MLDRVRLDALNTGGNAGVTSVSCSSAGNCAAGGFYADRSGHFQAFLVSERNGTWRKAFRVPGSGTLNARVHSVSCSSAGNCVAGGNYLGSHSQAFVASERNGTWGKAIKVPGSGALNTGGNAGVTSVSCSSAGNCMVGGFYSDGLGHSQAFVASERNGAWRKAIKVPGLAALNVGEGARVNLVTCGSAGNCAADGLYTDGSGHQQAFVVSQA